jgi:hypothetical protein
MQWTCPRAIEEPVGSERLVDGFTDHLGFHGSNRLKFKASGKSPITISEEFREYTLKQQRKTERCQHVTGCTWKHWDDLDGLDYAQNLIRMIGRMLKPRTAKGGGSAVAVRQYQTVGVAYVRLRGTHLQTQFPHWLTYLVGILGIRCQSGTVINVDLTGGIFFWSIVRKRSSCILPGGSGPHNLAAICSSKERHSPRARSPHHYLR